MSDLSDYARYSKIVAETLEILSDVHFTKCNVEQHEFSEQCPIYIMWKKETSTKWEMD